MQTLIARYESRSLYVRLAWLIGPAVVLNALYCLAYRYYAGNPATLIEAFSWGIINLAPWIAVIEIGRHLRAPIALALLVVTGGVISLGLEAALWFSWPEPFDVVRRLPGAFAAMIALISLAFLRSRRPPEGDKARDIERVEAYEWVRAAGNYVELHGTGHGAKIVRSTMADFILSEDCDLVRIHRSHAVKRSAVDRIERAHVRLADGTRLPIGDRYRDRLEPLR